MYTGLLPVPSTMRGSENGAVLRMWLGRTSSEELWVASLALTYDTSQAVKTKGTAALARGIVLDSCPWVTVSLENPRTPSTVLGTVACLNTLNFTSIINCINYAIPWLFLFCFVLFYKIVSSLSLSNPRTFSFSFYIY